MAIVSRAATKEYRANFDAVFVKRVPVAMNCPYCTRRFTEKVLEKDWQARTAKLTCPYCHEELEI